MDEDNVNMAQIFESPQDNRIDTPETIPPEPSSGFPAGFPDRRFLPAATRLLDRQREYGTAPGPPQAHN